MEIIPAHPHAILWPESGQSPTTSDSNALYYGDNLDILGRHVADASVDLVSLINFRNEIYLEATTRDEPRSAVVGSGRCIHGLNAVLCEACFDGNDRRQA